MLQADQASVTAQMMQLNICLFQHAELRGGLHLAPQAACRGRQGLQGRLGLGPACR